MARAAPVYLAWVLVLSGTALLALADVLPWRFTFLGPARASAALLAVELFLVMFAWAPVAARLAPNPKELGAHLAVLLGLAAPLALLAARLAGQGALPALRGQALVAAHAAFAGALLAARPAALPGYLLGAFFLSSVLPLGLFAAGSAADLAWACPFWAAAAPESGGALAQTLVLAGLAGGLAALPRAK